MKIYVARESGTNKVQGIFWASSKSDLFWAIDEHFDPFIIEYAEITPSSGIVNPKMLSEVKDYPQLGQLDNDEWDSAMDSFGDLGLTEEGEELSELLSAQDKIKWKKFTGMPL